FYLTDSPKLARWLAEDEKATLSQMLTAEHKADPVPQPGSARRRLFSELTSATVLKFSIAYFCLVNSLAMVAVWTPLIVKSFSGGGRKHPISLLGARPPGCSGI